MEEAAACTGGLPPMRVLACVERCHISRERADLGHRRLEALAAAEGLRYRMDLMSPVDTLDGHRVLHLAREQGCCAGPTRQAGRATGSLEIHLVDRERRIGGSHGRLLTLPWGDRAVQRGGEVPPRFDDEEGLWRSRGTVPRISAEQPCFFASEELKLVEWRKCGSVAGPNR